MLVRTRPFVPAFDTAQRVDRLFNELAGSLSSSRTRRIDAAWHDGELRLTVDLPGTPEEAIAVDVADRTLTVGVDHDGERWQRQVRLGDALDPTQIVARYRDGRLTVSVPKAAEPESRRIALDTTAPVATEETTTEATTEPTPDA